MRIGKSNLRQFSLTILITVIVAIFASSLSLHALTCTSGSYYDAIETLSVGGLESDTICQGFYQRFQFPVTSGRQYEVTVTPGSTANADLYLHSNEDVSNQTGDYTYSSTSGGTSQSETVAFTASVSGTYYAAVLGVSPTGEMGFFIRVDDVTPLPDLVAVNSSLRNLSFQTVTNPKVGDEVYFDFEYRLDNADINNSFIIKCDLDGSLFYSRTYPPVVTIGSRGASTQQGSKTWVVESGEHTVTWELDVANQVVETSEDNNDISKTYHVAEQFDLQRDSTDFVDSIGNSVVKAYIGDTVYFKLNYTVNGDGATPLFDIRCNLNGSPHWTDYNVTNTGGRSYDVIATTPFKVTEGTHSIEWILDFNDEVNESNELNNIADTGLTGHPQPLTPEVSVNPSSGPQGTTFDQPGYNFTPNGEATLYFDGPDGPSQFDNKQIGDQGAYEHSWTCQACPVGEYSYYAVDETTGTQSNTATFTVTATPVADTPFFSPLFRGYSATDTDHFYTTDPVERDENMPAAGYTYEKNEGYISNLAFIGGVTLYRLYHQSDKKHFYTIDEDERQTKKNDGYEDKGIAGYVYEGSAENLIPMYHLQHTTNGDHFYTISEFERDNAVVNYNYENKGIDFYVAQNSGAAPLAGKPVATQGGVNLASGNFVPYRNHVDLANPSGFGMPFVFARTYNSQNASEAGPLGPGWTHSYQIRIVNDGLFALVKWGNGRNDFYAVNGDTFTPAPGVYNTLEYVMGSYLLTTKNKTVYTFAQDITGGSSLEEGENCATFREEGPIFHEKGCIAIGRLEYITDRNGILLDLTLDPSKHNAIAFIEDGSGRIYRFHYQPVTGGAGFSETNADRLTSITEENAGSLTRSISFTYDIQGRLTTFTNAEGHVTSYAFNHPDIPGLLTKITLPEGNEITAEYDQVQRDRLKKLEIDNGSGTVKIVELEYDKIIDSSTGTRGTEYTVTTATGNITIAASHDDDYRLGIMKDPLGNIAKVEKYDSNLNPWQVKDKNGNIWSYDWDETYQTGNLKSIVNPKSEVTTYTYDTPNHPNNLITITDKEDNITRFSHDPNTGNVITITRVVDGVNRTTTIDRFANGQVEKVTFPPNNGAGTESTVRYIYDAYGYPATVTDHLDNIINFTYDPGGRLQAQEDADQVTVEYSYDLLNQVKTVKDMLDRVTSYSYDRNGNLETVTDPRAIITTYTYNDLDLVETVTRAGNRIAKYGYDESGRRNKVTNAKDRSWTTTFDKAGNLLTSKTPLGFEDTFPEYYPDGNLKRKQGRDEREINFSYDTLGRMTTSNITSGYQYSYDYWKNDLLKSVSRDGTPLGQFVYDERGNLTSYTDPFDTIVRYTYYPGGNLEKIIYPDSKEVLYDYDNRNLLTSVSFWGGRTIRYEYTDGGRLDKIIYPNNTVIDYVYDGYFRLKTISNQKTDGTVIAEYTVNQFDEFDAPLEISSTGGLDVAVAARSTSYSYDLNNRIQSAGSEPYSHNGQGEVLAAGGDTSYTWDNKDVSGRLQSMTVNGNTSSYQYDGLGNRIEKTVNGTTIRYLLDVSGRLANVMAETDDSGIVTAYYIHGLGLAARVAADDSVHYYHYDRRGNTVALSDGIGAVTDQYAYDPDPYAFSMVSEGRTENPFTFVGRYGVMAEGNDFFYMRARYYDAGNGCFLSEDPIGFEGGDLNVYAYVGGNPMAGIDPSGLDGAAVEQWAIQFSENVLTFLGEGYSGVTKGYVINHFLTNKAKKYYEKGMQDEGDAALAVAKMMSISIALSDEELLEADRAIAKVQSKYFDKNLLKAQEVSAYYLGTVQDPFPNYSYEDDKITKFVDATTEFFAKPFRWVWGKIK